jgi:hypothetical protein
LFASECCVRQKGERESCWAKRLHVFLTSIRVYLVEASYSKVLICHACVIIP